MKTYFEIADRVIQPKQPGEFGYDPAQSNEPVVTKWDVESLPKFTEKGFATIASAERVIVPSIWKAYFNMANAGINNLTNKLNSLLGSATTSEVQKDTNEPFRPIGIHTGIKANIGENEVVRIYNLPYATSGCFIANGVQVILHHGEIIIPMYNMMPSDVEIGKGDSLGILMVEKLGVTVPVVEEPVEPAEPVRPPEKTPEGTVNLIKEAPNPSEQTPESTPEPTPEQSDSFEPFGVSEKTQGKFGGLKNFFSKGGEFSGFNDGSIDSDFDGFDGCSCDADGDCGDCAFDCDCDD